MSSESNVATLQRFLRALGALDAPGMLAEFDERGTWELPFAPSGLQRRHTGRPALEAFIGGIPGAFDFLELSDGRYETTDGGRVVAELTGAGRVTATGFEYSNRYVFVAEFSEGGSITRLVEYYNPLQLLDAFGGPEALASLDGR